jgi:hypothetical protein
MIALTDVGLALLCIGATAIAPEDRARWLQRLATQIDPTPQAQYYHRHKNGKRVLRVEVEMGPVADLLCDHGFLQQWDSEDPEAVRRALEEALRVWALYS